MRTSEKLLWADGHISTLSHEDVLTRQKYDPELGYYFNKALNLGQDLHLTREPRHSYIHCPYNPIINEISTYFKDELESGKIEIIGKIRSEEREYYVLGGDAVISNGNGLGSFLTSFSASCITANN
nr:MAG TPA: hypothetical protein [Crassvirales sp.]